MDRHIRLFLDSGPNAKDAEHKMSTDHSIRVLSVDDHPLLSEEIATMINNQPDMELVATASTGKEGILKHREIKPDITLYGSSASRSQWHRRHAGDPVRIC